MKTEADSALEVV